MRALVLYCMLIATMLPTFTSWGVIAQYQLNKDYIARVLCENRDRPELHCDGQCYLAKRLRAQQDKQDRETTERVQSTPVIQLFCSAMFTFTCKPTVVTRQTSRTVAYLLTVYSAPLAAVFKPPGFGC